MPDDGHIRAGHADEPTEGRDGQLRGPKGERTRRRIMEATGALLTERPFADIRITDIARAADIAQPNFYTYFGNIEEVILAIAWEVSADELAVYIEPDWDGEAGIEHARKLVETAIGFWGRHREVLSITGVLADKRHGEFAAARVHQMRAVYKSFEEKVRKAQAQGAISPEITPRLAGYECVGVLNSAVQKYELMMASGFSRTQLIETTARILHLIATGGRV